MLLRRVALGAGFTSEQIDRGEIREGDARLLLQSLEAVQSWAFGQGDPAELEAELSPFVKSGIVKETPNG